MAVMLTRLACLVLRMRTKLKGSVSWFLSAKAQKSHLPLSVSTLCLVQVIADLEEERRKHAEDTAEGDDVTYILEKERERLHQQVTRNRFPPNHLVKQRLGPSGSFAQLFRCRLFACSWTLSAARSAGWKRSSGE